jgi:hypothetical protein
MRKVAPGTGTLTRKAEPVPTWQSVQWQTVVFSGSASPSTLIEGVYFGMWNGSTSVRCFSRWR